MTRAEQKSAFLISAGWGDADSAPLAGDASGRRYDRLSQPTTGLTAVLMDASPQVGEETEPFIRIASHLASIGLSSPRIMRADSKTGFLLLEDLGDLTFARLIEQRPDKEIDLYRSAVDVLIALREHPVPDGIPNPGPAELSMAVEPVVTWYATGCGTPVDGGSAETLVSLLFDVLSRIGNAPPVLALRDYHAENLIWLPDRDAPSNVGLLDFQDAFSGHPAYDLISLLEDARRDVSPQARNAAITHYVDRSGVDREMFEFACCALGAQRNLRILGVFARLCLHFGKPHYVDLIPRVWSHLQTDLSHPGLADLADFVHRTLPEPAPENLKRIKDQCGTAPRL